MFKHYKERIKIALVCVRDSEETEIDGICLLEFGEYAAVLGRGCQNQKNLTVTRQAGRSYWISGPEGDLERAIPQVRFPREIIQAVTQN